MPDPTVPGPAETCRPETGPAETGPAASGPAGTGAGETRAEATEQTPPATATSSARGSRRGSAQVAAGILVSRVTGLARERAFGHYLGTGPAADAFTAAFRIPNLLQHLLGEGVLSASFIPVYSRLLAQGRDEEAGRVAGAVLGLVAVAAGLLALVGVLLARPLTLVIAPGFADRPETLELTVSLVRVLFPATGLLALSAWCLGVLNSHRRFFLSYVAPALLNVVQIGVLVAGGLALTGTGTAVQASLVTWLAVGTVVGGALQFLVQLPGVLRVARGVRPSLRTDLPGVRDTLRAFGPVVAGRGVVQLSAYVQLVLASFLAAGALASLRYAQILYLLPISLFGMSVAAAELPELSRQGRDARDLVAARLRTGLTRIAVFVVPTALGYLLLGDLVTGALFQTGEFDRVDTLAVWAVLAGFSVGLLATTSSRLLQSALYAVGDARTPARTAVVRVVLSSALGAGLMLLLDAVAVTEQGLRLLEGPATGPDALRLGAAGLSLGSGLAAWVEYVLLRRAVGRSLAATTLAGGRLGRIVLAALVACLVVTASRPLLAPAPPLLAGTAAVALCAAVYAAVATALGVEEVRRTLAALRRRVPSASGRRRR